MTPSDRRQRQKLHWWNRGRADALVAVAVELRWTDPHLHATARRVGVEAGDLIEAQRRAAEYVS